MNPAAVFAVCPHANADIRAHAILERVSTRLSLSLLVSLLTVGCAARVMGDDELKSDDATDTMGTDETGAPPSGPTTTPPSSSTTDPTVGPDPTSETATATDGDTTDSGDDPVEPPCTPDDECMNDLDCAPGETCLANCTCFGTREPACDQAPSCEQCFFCSIGSGGGCDDLFGTCLANPHCSALLQCQLDCQDPQCNQACVAAHPAGIDDFFNLIGCVVSVCAAACN